MEHRTCSYHWNYTKNIPHHLCLYTYFCSQHQCIAISSFISPHERDNKQCNLLLRIITFTVITDILYNLILVQIHRDLDLIGKHTLCEAMQSRTGSDENSKHALTMGSGTDIYSINKKQDHNITWLFQFMSLSFLTDFTPRAAHFISFHSFDCM